MAQEKGTPERLPPQNLDAERSVLGGILRKNDVLDDIAPHVRAEFFYTDAHRKIYEAILSLYDRNLPVDTVTLAEELNRRGQIKDIGDYGYLTELWAPSPTPANARHYADIVREKALLRNLINASTDIL